MNCSLITLASPPPRSCVFTRNPTSTPQPGDCIVLSYTAVKSTLHSGACMSKARNPASLVSTVKTRQRTVLSVLASQTGSTAAR